MPQGFAVKHASQITADSFFGSPLVAWSTSRITVAVSSADIAAEQQKQVFIVRYHQKIEVIAPTPHDRAHPECPH